jgi:hypothetical protein
MGLESKDFILDDVEEITEKSDEVEFKCVNRV